MYNSGFRDKNLFSPNVVHTLVNRFAKCSRSYSDVVKTGIQESEFLVVNKVDSVNSKYFECKKLKNLRNRSEKRHESKSQSHLRF